MPKKGDAAREAVKNVIIKAFGEDYVGIQDKKIYVQAQDGPGGETLQFAISMTMPKNPLPAAGGGTWAPGGSLDSEDVPTVVVSEMSAADKAAVERLKQRLGIS